MALDFQQLDVVFDEGIDTKTNAKMAVKPIVLENAIFKEAKAINTRRGHTALSTSLLAGGSLPTEGQQLIDSRDEVLQVNADTLYGYSSALSKWVPRSNTAAIPSVSVKRTPVVQTSQSMRAQDACSVGNITMVAWEYGTATPSVHVIVFDNATGTILLQDTAVSASGRCSPRCFSSGSALYVLYRGYTTNALYWRKVTTAAPQTLVAETSIATNGSITAAEQTLDVAPYTASKAIVAYMSGTAGTTNVAIFDTATDTLSSSTTFAKPSRNSVSCIYIASLDHFFIAYGDYTPAVGVIELTAALGVSSAALDLYTASNANQVVVTAGSGATAGKAIVFYVDGTNNLLASRNGVAGAYAAQATFKANMQMAGKPFIQQSERIVVPVLHVATNVTDSGLELIDFERGDLVAMCLRNRAANSGDLVSGFSGSVPTIIGLSTTQFYWPVLEVLTVSASAGLLRGTVGISALTITFDATRMHASLGTNTFIACGRLLEFDGISPFENGFTSAPGLTAAANAAGGSMATGSYQVCVVACWIDAKGNRHRSNPSPIKTIAVTGPTGKIDCTIYTNQCTEKRSTAFGARQEIFFEVYSTEASGTTFYRVTSLTAPTFSSVTAASIAFSRTAADASIIGNDVLYTTGGVLENIPAPATNVVVAHRNRLFVISSEFPTQVWYSKLNSPGDAVAFNDLQVIDVGDAGGDCTALASLDDKLIVFKKNTIIVVAGDGPDDTGSQNTFSLPAIVSSDVGCSAPNSVVLTPEGILFQSASGICILTRSLSVEYIGAAVEAYNAQTITAALLVADQDQARFYTAGGTCLVWDYLFNQWCTFTNISAADATLSGNVLHFLLTTGEVRKEASATYNDNGTDYYMRVRTPWIKSSLQGIMRLKRIAILGDYKTAHTLQVKVYRDYDDALVETFSKATSAFVSGTAPEQIEFDLANQKAEAFSFEIQATGAGAGQALSLSGLSLTVGTKQGAAKLPATKVY